MIAGAQLPNSQVPNIPNLNNQTSPLQTSSFNSTNPTNPTNHSTISNLTIIALVTLAGFNWEWSVIVFKRIGDSFKGIAEPEHKIER